MNVDFKNRYKLFSKSNNYGEEETIYMSIVCVSIGYFPTRHISETLEQVVD